MESALVQTQNFRRSGVRLLKVAKRIAAVAVLVWLIPIPMVLMLASGILDLGRNKGLNGNTVNRYFFGNGLLTWILSPLNLMFDLVCLPRRNRGIYKLADLPEAHQKEIQTLVDYAYQQQLAQRICEQLNGKPRGMMMFKWYGKNFDTSLAMPDYHQKYRYVQTIGVSVFNKRQSTSLHFGPLRATLRVLYNINDFTTHDAYIDVGNHRHYWANDKLFIFDDTLQHRSVNDSDALRVCLFVDILRPSPAPALLRFAIGCVRRISQPIRERFYKNWSFLK